MGGVWSEQEAEWEFCLVLNSGRRFICWKVMMIGRVCCVNFANSKKWRQQTKSYGV